MEALDAFESEMEADGQGNYSLFPALDSIANLSGTPETLDRLFAMSYVFALVALNHKKYSCARCLLTVHYDIPVKRQRSQTSHGWTPRRYYSSNNQFQ